MDNLLVKWNGPHKIKGIIAMRSVFDLGLKEAINLLQAEDGFVVSPLQWVALRGEYMLKRGSSADRCINDWIVETYVQAIPAWLVDKHVREDFIMEDR